MILPVRAGTGLLTGIVTSLASRGAPPPFNGGLFTNGGFDESLTGWNTYVDGWSWLNGQAVFDGLPTAEDPLWQNFTTSATKRYKISGVLVSGIATYMVNDVDSGVPVGNDYEFDGLDGVYSIGVLPIIGQPCVIDNMRLAEMFTYLNYISGETSEDGFSITLTFDDAPNSIPAGSTIHIDGEDQITTNTEIVGLTLVMTLMAPATLGDVVTVSLNRTGTNLPTLTNAPVTNNSTALETLVTHNGELVTYNGENVTYIRNRT